MLWLWCRAAAVAPIQSLAWERPYAVGAALKSRKKKKKKKKKKNLMLLLTLVPGYLPGLLRGFSKIITSSA